MSNRLGNNPNNTNQYSFMYSNTDPVNYSFMSDRIPNESVNEHNSLQLAYQNPLSISVDNNLADVLENITRETQLNENDSNKQEQELFSSSNFPEDSFSNELTSNLSYDDFFDTNILLKRHKKRAATAPTKILNEAEGFLYSVHFLNLEKLVKCSQNLIMRNSKFDIDSEEGSEVCKQFLDKLELLIKVNIFNLVFENKNSK